MGKLAGYGGHRNVSPCQSSRPQNRFLGRKYSSLQLGDRCGGKGGRALDRTVVVEVATQESVSNILVIIVFNTMVDIVAQERYKESIFQNYLQ